MTAVKSAAELAAELQQAQAELAQREERQIAELDRRKRTIRSEAGRVRTQLTERHVAELLRRRQQIRADALRALAPHVALFRAELSPLAARAIGETWTDLDRRARHELGGPADQHILTHAFAAALIGDQPDVADRFGVESNWTIGSFSLSSPLERAAQFRRAVEQGAGAGALVQALSALDAAVTAIAKCSPGDSRAVRRWDAMLRDVPSELEAIAAEEREERERSAIAAADVAREHQRGITERGRVSSGLRAASMRVLGLD